MTSSAANAEAGAALPAWHLAHVSADHMKTVAAIYRDPNPVHWDREAVAARGLGPRTINQGPICLGYILNMLMAWAGPACLRHTRMRFLDVVFDGDAVTAAGVVRAVEDLDGERIASCDVWLDRGDGRRVLEGTARVVLPARAP